MSKHGRGTCPVCGQQAPDNLLCSTCTTGLLIDLQDLPGLMRDLMLAYTKRQAFHLVGLDSTPANADAEESPLPYSPHHRRVHDAIINSLGTWVRVLAEDNSDTLRDLGRTTEHWCIWLRGHVQWIRVHPAVVDIDRDIRNAADRARRSVDLPPDLTFVTVCPTCSRGVFARPDEDTAVCIHCRRAGITPLPRYSVAEAKAYMLQRLEHQWLTVPSCAHWLGELGLPVKAQTIYHWTQEDRGARLHPRGRNALNQNLYRLGDVADLVRDAINRKARA